MMNKNRLWVRVVSLVAVLGLAVGASASPTGGQNAESDAEVIARQQRHIIRQEAIIEAQRALIKAQESLLNSYRCMFNIDTQLVPGGCDGPGGEMTDGGMPEPEPTDEDDNTEPEPTDEDDNTEPEPTDEDDNTEPEPTDEDDNTGCVASVDVGTEPAEGLLPIDPAVRIGKLDNGLTFYVRSNDSPGGSLTLWLAVNAGSLNEPVEGGSHAHFVEHMLLHGTEKYPGTGTVDALQGVGVEAAHHITTATSYDETLYGVDVIIDEDEQSVDVAFDVLSQWAFAATIDPDVVEAERGVLREEYRRVAETGSGAVAYSFDHLYNQGTPYEGRLPIGSAEGIESVTASELRDFYEAWYVPSNMAVVAVGDLPVDTLQGLVEEYFCDAPEGEAPSATYFRSALNSDPAFGVATSPDLGYDYLSLDVRLPPWDRDTVEGDRHRWIEQIIRIVVDNRLQDAYEQGLLSQSNAPHWGSFHHSRGLRYYGSNFRADDYSAALTDFWSLLLSLKEHGFTDADLARADKAIRADLEAAVLEEASTRDNQFASRYATHFLAGADIGTAQDRADRIGALLDEIQVEDLSDRFRWILDHSGPLLLALGEDPAEVPTVEEMQAALDAATAGELPEFIEEVDQLMEAPDPVDPVSSGPIVALANEFEDAYEWAFDNGARVMFIDTDIRENEVYVLALGLGGWTALEEGERPLAEILATRAVRNSGLGDLTPSQLSRYLDGRNAQATPYIAPTTDEVDGSADVGDVETLFQLIHLYMTEPRVDEQAFEEAIELGELLISLVESNPGWMAEKAYFEARHGEQVKWFHRFAPQETLDSLTPESLLDLYQQRLGKVDDLIVAVVGDVDRDTVEQMARTYVGTLPAGSSDTFVNHYRPRPDGVVRQEVVLAEDSQETGGFFHYEVPIVITVELEAAVEVLEVIVNERLSESAGEDLGASYSASAWVHESHTPSPVVNSRVNIAGDPEHMEAIEAEVSRILADLHSGGITAEEFELAVLQVSDDLRDPSVYDLANPLWHRALINDDQLPTPERLLAALEEMQLADVQSLATTLFDPEQHIRIIRVLP